MSNSVKLNLSGHFNKDLSEKGFGFPGTIQIDPTTDYTANLMSVTKFLKEQGIQSNSVVIIALPGMSLLASMVIVGIHGLTGQMPTVAPLVRTTEGEFVNTEFVDLQSLRNQVSRSMRDSLISL